MTRSVLDDPRYKTLPWWMKVVVNVLGLMGKIR